MGKPEAIVENYLVERVESAGGEARKAKWINRRGAPDRRIMLPWECSWVECKRPGVELEEHQRREINKMLKYGEIVYVVTTKLEVDLFMKRKLPRCTHVN